MTDTPLHYLSIAELGRRYRDGSLSPVTVTEHLLARIDRLNPRLHAFQQVTRERALAEARTAEVALAGGQDLGPLHGIPYAAKDLYDVKGLATTAGTRLLEDNIAERDCAVVRKLALAGMVLLGKTYTVQFAFGGVGINHDQGTPHNPWHAEPHAPGGSSSGTAVAVSSGLAPMALGSDTGGSVRIPAALCGITGLKTTVGRISRAGVYPLSWTLDTVGPLTRSVEDAALVYMALQGPDEDDETTVGVTPHDVLAGLGDGVRGLRIAFCETLFFDDVDPEVEAAVRKAGTVLESLGAQMGSVEVPEVTDIFTFGRRDLMVAAEGYAVNAHLLENHFDDLDPAVSHRMKGGMQLSAKDYFLMLRQWAQLRRRIGHTLRDVEALIVPTTQVPARSLAVIDADDKSYALHNLKYLRNTAVGNLLDFCAVSVPCGRDANGLPIGLMVYAKPFAEDVALRVGQAYAQASGLLGDHPDLAWAGE